jgi:urease accessory protein
MSITFLSVNLSMKLSRLLVLAVTALGSSPALAHTGTGEVISSSSGFAHPFHGLDHVLAMTAVGMWAGFLGRRAVSRLPFAFLSAMLVGVTLALAGLEIPAVEIGIAASVLVLGTAIALGLRLPAATAAIACGIFGLVHGYAHGIEMGKGGSAVHFIAGFVLATALLHTGGLVAATSLVRNKPILNRLLGGGIAFAGAALLFA